MKYSRRLCANQDQMLHYPDLILLLGTGKTHLWETGRVGWRTTSCIHHCAEPIGLGRKLDIRINPPLRKMHMGKSFKWEVDYR